MNRSPRARVEALADMVAALVPVNDEAARAAEVARIRRHFDGAFAMLAVRDSAGLSAPQRKRRQRLVDWLADYRARGRFPKNARFVARTPFFVDPESTRCAMAHLIDASGHRRLVERIAAHENNALVRALAGDPELRDWLEGHGLTLAEAARIQPSYSPDFGLRMFCGGAPYKDLVRAEITATGEGRVLEVFATTVGAQTGQLLKVKPLRFASVPVPGDEMLLVPDLRAPDARAPNPDAGIVWYPTRIEFGGGAASLTSMGQTVKVSVKTAGRAFVSKDCVAYLRNVTARPAAARLPDASADAATDVSTAVVLDAATLVAPSAPTNGDAAIVADASPVDTPRPDASVDAKPERAPSGGSGCSAHGSAAPTPADALCFVSAIVYAAMRRGARTSAASRILVRDENDDRASFRSSALDAGRACLRRQHGQADRQRRG